MRIGLISLSGIQLRDPQLREQGITLPGVVERSRVIASLPNLGLLTLAGLTPSHHQLLYRDVEGLDSLGTIDEDIDLAVLSSYTAQSHEAYRVAAFFRDHGVPVVMGGLHASMEPREASTHCDSILIGEGEAYWKEMIQDAERGELKPFYGSLDNQFDLRESPVPAYSLLKPEHYNRITIQTARGCPWRCDFCASSILLSRAYRQKPIELVLRDIAAIKSIWHRPFIEFVDDNAFVDIQYWRSLLSEMRPLGIRWFAETDISVGQHPSFLELLRDSGCRQLLIGLESPVVAGLDGVELRANWKRHKLPSYLAAIRRIQSYGIRVIGCFVVGLDGQDASVFEEIYRFSVDSELFDVQITLPTPFPGTPFYARLLRENRLLKSLGWDHYTLFDLVFQPANMSQEELRLGFRDLARRLYSKRLSQWRRDNFRQIQRTSRLSAGC